MNKLSIKKVNRLIMMEKPKAIAKYLRKYLPESKLGWADVRLDEYAHSLVKDLCADKSAVLKKLEELSK